MKRYIITFLAAFVLAGHADAAPIVINISAQVNNVFDPDGFLGGAISVGDTITGTYIYESTTPDTNSLPNVGDYEHKTAPFGIALQVGELVFRTDPSQVDMPVEIVNDFPGDRYLLFSGSNIFSKSVPGSILNGIAWELDDPAGTALSSDALPTRPPALADWQFNTLSILSVNPFMRSDFSITAQVTSAVLIPEPSSSLLLCAGLGSLIGYTLWMGKSLASLLSRFRFEGHLEAFTEIDASHFGVAMAAPRASRSGKSSRC